VGDELLISRLLDGERILWSGKPGQGLLLIKRDFVLIPLSLYWCGLAISFVLLTIPFPRREYDWVNVGGFIALARLIRRADTHC
jgi:hypothetical protein